MHVEILSRREGGEPSKSTGEKNFRERAQELLKSRREVQYFAYGANLDPDVLTGIRRVKPIASRAGYVEGYR